MNKADTITVFINEYDEPVKTLATKLRKFLLQQLPGIAEEPDIAAKLIGYNYGPGYKNVICVILLSKKEVKLGLNKSAGFPDPAKLLTGTGKVHKYVLITDTLLKENTPLRNLLAHAIKVYNEKKV